MAGNWSNNIRVKDPGQTSNFTCAEINCNDLPSNVQGGIKGLLEPAHSYNGQ